jgi:ATP-dependent Lhr-like helicase
VPNAPDAKIGQLRFFARGTGRLWLSPPVDDSALSDAARSVRDVLRAQGASFTTDLAAASALGSQRLRDALRELVATGLATNDTIEALRDVLRWRPVFPAKRRDEPDPTRWLPEGFTPSPNRYVVQRRVNPRSLAKWKRPDRPEAASGWGGRWSLVHAPGVLGAAPASAGVDDDAPSAAELVARQWLARYGVVSRDWWRRERPNVSWREIYHELKRLEFRGEVRRGYFVAGLGGAQFALPEAVEMLRAPADDALSGLAPVVLATSDPANVHALPLAGDVSPDPLGRPRGAGALLVTVRGRVIVAAESRGARLRVRDDADDETVRTAVRALAERLAARARGGKQRDVMVETVGGEPASASRWAEALREIGFRSMGGAMRYYAGV